jgi:hypothetical protein
MKKYLCTLSAALATGLLGILLLGTGPRSFAAGPASGVQFWLGGVDPVVVNDRHTSDPADFMQLFQPDAPWERGASRVTAFKISMQFASRSSEADATTLIADLRRRGIGLAIEMGMLRNDRGCGKGEGYMPQALLENAMKRIQRLGGKLDYIAMDEVVFFGRERYWPDKQGPACKDTVEELVEEVVPHVALIHRYFPEAQIGMIEPITTNQGLEPKKLVQDYLNFADLYRAKTGTPLAFFHTDIAWRSKNWQPAIAPLKSAMHARGIRFGIIIGGNPDYTDDVSWTRAGLDQLKTLSGNPATAPEDIIIQSWQPLPKRYLPETAVGTSTWMLLQAQTMVH